MPGFTVSTGKFSLVVIMWADWDPIYVNVEPMETESTETSFHWYYEERGVWHRIEDIPGNFLSSSDLESYYSRDPSGSLEITTQIGRFKIDFRGSQVINLITGHRQKIRRLFGTDHRSGCPCADKTSFVPTYWQKMDNKAPYEAFHVLPKTSEYNDVERYVREIGLMQEPIQAIYRVQNVDLWQLYCSKKTQLMRIKCQSTITEERLFHGTGRDNLHSICTYNFNCRIAENKRSGHLYGKGTYFAKHAPYAEKYSRIHQGNSRSRFMFLARVIVGKYTTGQQDICKPDGDQNENVHDSCVDDTLYPRIFVVFDCNQIYPEYVLEFGC